MQNDNRQSETVAEAKSEATLAAPYGSASSRAEHLAWCKKRALEYCDMGDVNQAYASMASDLGKHPDTKGHAAIQLGMMMLMGGHLNSPMEMRKFIEGFN
jgi:hypothetical protein